MSLKSVECCWYSVSVWNLNQSTLLFTNYSDDWLNTLIWIHILLICGIDVASLKHNSIFTKTTKTFLLLISCSHTPSLINRKVSKHCLCYKISILCHKITHTVIGDYWRLNISSWGPVVVIACQKSNMSLSQRYMLLYTPQKSLGSTSFMEFSTSYACNRDHFYLLTVKWEHF